MSKNMKIDDTLIEHSGMIELYEYFPFKDAKVIKGVELGRIC